MGYLYFNSKTRVEIDADVQSYHDEGNPSFYRVRSAKPLFTRMYEDWQLDIRKSKVNKVVLHHDGMSTARGCFDVLRQRNLSSHLLIDRDGTVLQPLALQDVAYHVLGYNRESVGIDLNNPVRPDRARRGETGKVFRREINGGAHRSLGYTDAQYEALAAVLDGIFRLFGEGIKREAPIGEDGRIVNRCLANPKDFSGIVGHWHLKASKWDPGPGFDWERTLVAIRASRVFYPVTLAGQRNLGQVSKRYAPKLATAYFEHVEGGDGGYFPVGVNQAWHTGAHFRVDAGTQVRAPVSGKVVVARNAERTPKLGDANVLVIKHELKVNQKDLVFFSVLSHMRYEPKQGADSPIPWMRRLATLPDPGLPDDGGPRRSAPGASAMRNGWVALLEVEVKAGEVVGHVGTFSSSSERAPKPVLDAAIISTKPIFPKSDRTFEVVDDDDDEGLLCNSRAVWRRLVEDPEVLDGLVRGGYPLAPSEVQTAYEDGKAARDLRWLAVRHVTEYNANTDLSDLFGGGVDFEWHAEKAAKDFKRRFGPFLWWDAGVTKHAELPEDGLVYAYHPIALLTVLAVGQARSAMSVGQGGAQQGLEDQALVAQKKLEREEGDVGTHEDVNTSDLVEEENLDEAAEVDPDREVWMRWEQGEWAPPEQ